MPYDARVYRILIASPSDVEEERELAVRVIQEWNDLYSYSRKVVLLPLRWETHTAPEYGTRPQEVINRAIVDQCDLLLGMFWTRIGTPTGAAESGTLEEVERVAGAGKPVMLYFSKAGIDPATLDLDQVARLKMFKEKTYPNALTESYKSIIEFRDKLAKQLELKVRDLQKTDDSGQPPPLNLELVSTDAAKVLGRKARHAVKLPVATDLNDVLAGVASDKARSRIQEAVKSQIAEAVALPVLLAISNTSASGVRNLYVEMFIRSETEGVEIIDPIQRTMRGTRAATLGFWLFSKEFALPREKENKWEATQSLTKRDDGWTFSFEWGALQPQRVRFVQPQLLVSTERDAAVEFTAKVFADSFPQPVILNATLEVNVQRTEVSVKQLLKNLEDLKTQEDREDDKIDAEFEVKA
jgi:hypothetical protein